MTTPQAPLPKRRPLRTCEELLQAGRQRAGGMRPAPEPAERLAALLMLAFPATSASKDGPAPWLSLDPAMCRGRRCSCRCPGADEAKPNATSTPLAAALPGPGKRKMQPGRKLAQARSARYAVQQAHEQASAAVARLQRRVTETSKRSDRSPGQRRGG